MILVKDLGMEFPNEKSKRKYRYGIYKCDSCSRDFRKRTANVNSNSVCVSCSSKDRFSKHNGKRDKLYSVWIGIKQRCSNINSKSFKHYGGRGITVCSDWLDYSIFKEWSIDNGYVDGLSIDRIDVNGNYEPNNCRWTTRSIQMQNTRLIHSTNKSGYRGVYFNKTTNKWRCNIQIDKKRIHLGYFDTALEAAYAYDNFVISNNLQHPLNNKDKKC